jgi:hypothetical protein
VIGAVNRMRAERHEREESDLAASTEAIAAEIHRRRSLPGGFARQMRRRAGATDGTAAATVIESGALI